MNRSLPQHGRFEQWSLSAGQAGGPNVLSLEGVLRQVLHVRRLLLPLRDLALNVSVVDSECGDNDHAHVVTLLLRERPKAAHEQDKAVIHQDTDTSIVLLVCSSNLCGDII